LTGNSPEVDPAKGTLAKAHDGEIEHLPTKATLIEIETTPAVSQKDKGPVAGAGVLRPTSEHALEEAFCNAIRQVVRAVVNVEIMVSDRVVATLLAASVLVKDVEE